MDNIDISDNIMEHLKPFKNLGNLFFKKKLIYYNNKKKDNSIKINAVIVFKEKIWKKINKEMFSFIGDESEED